jgi:hypothetical protein
LDENITFVFAEKWPFNGAVGEFQLLGRVQVNAGTGGTGLSRADVKVSTSSLMKGQTKAEGCPRQAWANLIKLFINFRYKIVFVPGKPFQHNLMFVGKAGAYPIEEPFR